MLVTLPYKILVGERIAGNISPMLEKMDFGKGCLVLCGANTKRLVSRHINEISSSFDVDVMEPLHATKKRMKPDFIVGIGGGKTIDAAKYIAHISDKPWVAFPTILSHDGVVSSRAVLNDNNNNWMSIEASEPSAIIADLSVIRGADYKYLSAGVGDLISNFSAVEDWKLADKAGKEKYHEIMGKLSLISAEAIAIHISSIRKKDYHSLEVLFWSLVSSGFAMNIYGSSRPCSGSEHNISHALYKLGSTALHGHQVALATIVVTYLQKGDWKKIRGMLMEAGIPASAKALGIGRDTMIRALVSAKDVRDRYTILDEYKLTKDSAEKVLKKVGII